ncbi:hypothetical protein GCK72_008211 [Caenorhabditis remanei]|uniref:ATP-dependent DNA helicase n=1 Tax=Caenorhabditis remanei TaxID=31234 RepID=A0A6A5GZM4_CAERE|nr:hypothetical protein GCK72_008211 [Caenorhabditis remanei]KAF1759966.1 hypothetical protein GCK72_008211 [Caenorhabditis remanei]
MGTETFTVMATETFAGRESRGSIRPWQLKQFSIDAGRRDVSRIEQSASGMIPIAAGLRAKLTFAMGSRVMLRRTVDRVKGLVNGLTGVLEEVQRVGEMISTIGIRFDRLPEEIVRIARVPGTYELNRGVKMTRSHFPLEPAPAVTIHKFQGLNNVLLATSSIFTTAQFFVGCSRARTMDGLHLIDLDPTKATADPKAIKGYDRLRTQAVINDASEV